MNAKETRARTARETATLLRRCLTALAAICVVATTIELAMLRHWGSFERTIPFYALAILTACIIAFLVRPTPRTIRVVRIGLGLVAMIALVGLYEHIHENYIAGPLDYRYADVWPHMSMANKLWDAFTETVGPAPTLAPLVLFQGAILLFLATLRHPSFYEKGNDPGALAEVVALDLVDVIRSASRGNHDGHDADAVTHPEEPATDETPNHTVVDVLAQTVLDLRSSVAHDDAPAVESVESVE